MDPAAHGMNYARRLPKLVPRPGFREVSADAGPLTLQLTRIDGDRIPASVLVPDDGISVPA